MEGNEVNHTPLNIKWFRDNFANQRREFEKNTREEEDTEEDTEEDNDKTLFSKEEVPTQEQLQDIQKQQTIKKTGIRYQFAPYPRDRDILKPGKWTKTPGARVRLKYRPRNEKKKRSRENVNYSTLPIIDEEVEPVSEKNLQVPALEKQQSIIDQWQSNDKSREVDRDNEVGFQIMKKKYDIHKNEEMKMASIAEKIKLKSCYKKCDEKHEQKIRLKGTLKAASKGKTKKLKRKKTKNKRKKKSLKQSIIDFLKN